MQAALEPQEASAGGALSGIGGALRGLLSRTLRLGPGAAARAPAEAEAVEAAPVSTLSPGLEFTGVPPGQSEAEETDVRARAFRCAAAHLPRLIAS